VGIAVGSVMVAVIDGTILNLALPSLVRELGASNSDLQWIIDAYVLVFAGFMLTGGSLADRFGRVRLMRIGMTLFGVSSLVASQAPNAEALIACRAVMGIGAAILSPATLSIVTNLFDDPVARTKAIGVWAGGSMIGIAIGPIAGGLLLTHFWWGSVFLVNVPIVVASVPLLGALVPESKNPAASRLDPIGMLLSTGGLAIILWATISAPDRGWTDSATLAAYGAGAAVLVAFVLFELRNPFPLLDVRFFAERGFVVPTLASAVVMFNAAGVLFVLSQLLQSVHGYTPLQAGVRLLPMAGVLVAGSVLSARVSGRIGARQMIVLGLVLQGAGGMVLGLPGADAPYWPLLAGMLLYGIGQSMAFSPAVGLVMAAVPKERAGVASGTNNTARQSGAALGVAVTGSILASVYKADLHNRIAPLALPAGTAHQAEHSVGSAFKVAASLTGTSGDLVTHAARQAFVAGAARGLTVNAAICVAAAVLFALLSAREATPRGRSTTQPIPNR
jgi:EmrB/QacA subfamily drug resistance transporter